MPHPSNDRPGHLCLSSDPSPPTPPPPQNEFAYRRPIRLTRASNDSITRSTFKSSHVADVCVCVCLCTTRTEVRSWRVAVTNVHSVVSDTHNSLLMNFIMGLVGPVGRTTNGNGNGNGITTTTTTIVDRHQGTGHTQITVRNCAPRGARMGPLTHTHTHTGKCGQLSQLALRRPPRRRRRQRATVTALTRPGPTTSTWQRAPASVVVAEMIVHVNILAALWKTCDLRRRRWHRSEVHARTRDEMGRADGGRGRGDLTHLAYCSGDG